MAKAGFFPMARVITLRQLGSPLQGHPDRMTLPGVEAATGSLGQGLSAALGMALGLTLAGKKARVYCVLGDGEIQEGRIWESAMSAPKLGAPAHHLGLPPRCDECGPDGLAQVRRPSHSAGWTPAT